MIYPCTKVVIDIHDTDNEFEVSYDIVWFTIYYN
jgi:hypothetical protein